MEIDPSGLATFAASDLLTTPGLVDGTRVKFSAPILEPFQNVSSGSTFAVRAKRGTQMVSNVVTITYVSLNIPAARRGAPSMALQTILKAWLEQTPSLRESSQRIRPGSFLSQRAALGMTSPIPDIQAEATLRQAFGVSAVRPAGAGTGQGKMAFGVSQKFGQPIIDAYQRITNCIAGVIDRFGTSAESTADANACMDSARLEFRDNIIPGIAEIPEETSSVTSILGTHLRGSLGRFFANRVADAALSAEMAETATALGQVVLTVPFDSPQAQVDYFSGRLTEVGKQKIYERLTEDLPEVAQYLLRKIGAPEYFSQVLTLPSTALPGVYLAENSIASSIDASNFVVNAPTVFGGEDPATANTPTEIPIGIEGASMPVPPGATPASVCAAHPELNSAFVSLGFSSCEQYITPFFDKEFMATTLLPLMEALAAIDLSVCNPNPDTPACDAALAEATAVSDQLFGVIRGYQSDDAHCDSGYTEYNSQVANVRTCIFAALAYTPPAGTCFAGSRRSPFDVGSASVCVYYSRDYIVGGTCRTNYSRVFFLGTDRCRWSTLAVSKPAAYSLNTITGARTVLEK